MLKAAALSKKTPAHSFMEESPTYVSAWQSWFQRNGPRLLLCARQWTRSLADAEDVVQEAFVRFWRNQKRLGGEPFPLLMVSVRRAAIDLARSNGRRTRREEKSGELLPDMAEPLFETESEGDERRIEIEAALRSLPVEQREVLVLKIWGELTLEQIAGQLDISPSTAASRYRYALTHLRKQLTPACHG
ncbi:MAG TPA: sigma-70 family RNA polymerase sigma factor [Opitutaceae bacterium]|nr:sigma-70 family RNA polymerase sigma factor [Opitutaceae bacterium]